MNVESVSAILREGSPVSTKIGSGPAWYRNIVCRCEDERIFMLLTDRYLENIVNSGTLISVKFFNDFFVYLFEGIIETIHAGSPGYVIVRITNAEEIINTRLSPRYDTYLSANIKSEWDNHLHFSVVTDISYGGMAFMSTHRFDYGEDVDTLIYLPINQIFATKGKIIRRSVKSGIIDYSMQFLETNESACGLLSKYFSHLDAENTAMYQHYLAYSGRQ